MNKKTVITGIGPICSVGIGENDFWQGLIKKKTNICSVSSMLGNKEWHTFVKHSVDNFDVNAFGLDPDVLRGINEWRGNVSGSKDLNYLMAAGKLALDNSQLCYKTERNKIALIVAHENPGLEEYFSSILDNAFEYFDQNKSATEKMAYYNFMLTRMMKASFELQTFMPLHHVSRILGVHGITFFNNNACSSGAYALEQAKMIIDSDHADVVLVVGADCPDIYKYLWFKQLKMCAEDGLSRPFCKGSLGFVLGDGATGIVMESIEHASKRSAHIYAEYLGGGFFSEGWKVTLPSVVNKYYVSSMETALKRCALDPEEVDLIVPHGIGTSLSDQFEATSIQTVFTNHKIVVTPLKPYFGHNLGGGVLLEVAALMLMFKHKKILPALNLSADNLSVPLNISDLSSNKNFEIAMKSTCAFAGFDSAMLFKRV